MVIEKAVNSSEASLYNQRKFSSVLLKKKCIYLKCSMQVHGAFRQQILYPYMSRYNFNEP